MERYYSQIKILPSGNTTLNKEQENSQKHHDCT